MAKLADNRPAPRIHEWRARVPSSDEIDDWDTHGNGLLGMIYETVGLMLPQITKLSKATVSLEQIAYLIAAQEKLLKKILAVPGQAWSGDSAARECEAVHSISHSVLRRDLHFLSVSESYSELFEFTPSEFEVLSFEELLHPLDRPRFSEKIAALLEGRVPSCELVEWRATGSHRFVLIRDSIFAIGVNQAGAPAYIANISERVTDKRVATALAHAVEGDHWIVGRGK